MTHLFLMIGTSELLLIAAVVLLLFGGKKLPEMMKGLGQGVKSFKQGMNEPLEESSPKAAEETANGEVATAQTAQSEATAEAKKDDNAAKE